MVGIISAAGDPENIKRSNIRTNTDWMMQMTQKKEEEEEEEM